MKTLIAALALSLIAAPAFALCIGSDTLQSCTDTSGNSYTINRMGNTTFMNGSNAETGSQWNQTSTTVGNSTFHNGTDKDGNSWSTSCINGICN
ncbi:hypothetical protein [Ensifer canadensis]